jgi:hypothetical protein
VGREKKEKKPPFLSFSTQSFKRQHKGVTTVITEWRLTDISIRLPFPSLLSFTFQYQPWFVLRNLWVARKVLFLCERNMPTPTFADAHVID